MEIVHFFYVNNAEINEEYTETLHMSIVHSAVFARVLCGEKALQYIKFCTSPFNYSMFYIKQIDD